MSTPNPAPSSGQQFFAMILHDLLSTGGSPLLTFFAAFGAAAGDPIKIGEAFLALQGAEIGQLTPFESLLSQQIAAAFIAKIKGVMGQAPAP
jgi:hypothetical protein